MHNETLGWLISLAKILYTYLTDTHPVAILLVYLLVYVVFVYCISRVDRPLKHTDQDTILYMNPMMMYGKGKYTYNPSGIRPEKSQRRGRPKPPPKQPKFQTGRKHRRYDGWGLVYQ